MRALSRFDPGQANHTAILVDLANFVPNRRRERCLGLSRHCWGEFWVLSTDSDGEAGSTSFVSTPMTLRAPRVFNSIWHRIPLEWPNFRARHEALSRFWVSSETRYVWSMATEPGQPYFWSNDHWIYYYLIINFCVRITNTDQWPNNILSFGSSGDLFCGWREWKCIL